MSRSLRSFPVLLLALVVLAGCDAALTGDSVVLNADISADKDGAPIRFGFNAADVTAGRLIDISCGCSLDVGNFLADRGFTKADIVSATVTSARLVMLFPISERLDFLDQAILKLQAPGNSATEVASLTSFGQTREVNMVPQSSRDVAGLVDEATFRPLLQIDAKRLVNGADYEIGLVMSLRIEVQGL